MSEWININHSLPPKDDYVLVYSEDLESSFVACMFNGKWTAYVEHVDSGCQNPVFDDFYSQDISHWMPLPEPPK